MEGGPLRLLLIIAFLTGCNDPNCHFCNRQATGILENCRGTDFVPVCGEHNWLPCEEAE